MINCSLFPSILKLIDSRTQLKLPKFRIGDLIEVYGQDDDGAEFWECGIIKGIIAPQWHRNATKDQWLYYFEITETSYGYDFKGASGEAFENELILLR